MREFPKLTKRDLAPSVKLVAISKDLASDKNIGAHRHGNVYEIHEIHSNGYLRMDNEYNKGTLGFDIGGVLDLESYNRQYGPCHKFYILREWITDEDLFALKMGLDL